MRLDTDERAENPVIAVLVALVAVLIVVAIVGTVMDFDIHAFASTWAAAFAAAAIVGVFLIPFVSQRA